MTTLPLLITLYAATVFAALAGYVVYLQYSSLRGDESEIRVLERLELHLAHILRLLEAPDVGTLLQAPASRQRLFLDFSSLPERGRAGGAAHSQAQARIHPLTGGVLPQLLSNAPEGALVLRQK